MERLDKINWRESFGFECYDIKLGFRTDCAELKSKLEKILPRAGSIVAFEGSESRVSLVVNQSRAVNGLYFDNDAVMEFETYDDGLLEFIEDKLLKFLAVKSLPEKFYVHAGAVVWCDLGILVPGDSRAGKTTLVKELIKAGAEYYSDDCMILDAAGDMLPFPRALAIRTEAGRIFREAEHFGATTGVRKAKLDLILFAVYEKDSAWHPSQISKGAGVLKLMDNFFYKGSIGTKPRQILEKLAAIMKEAEIWSGKRGEAETVVEWLAENYKERIEK